MCTGSRTSWWPGWWRRACGDLLTDVAEPLPVAVIAEMLGIPESDRAPLRPWSADICGMYELNPSEETARRAVRASVEFSEYLRGLIAARRKDPGEDLISGLIAAHDEDDRLTEQEMISTAVLLLNAGHEATVNATANGWWALFRHPGQLAALRADHSLVPSAVEELLRYDTPLQLFERWVLDEIEIDGTVIPRGAELALLFGSANHDPEVFEAPETLDLARRDNPHISFSSRHPLLHRRAPRPDGTGGLHDRPPDPRPHPAPRGGTGPQAELRHARPGGPDRGGRLRLGPRQRGGAHGAPGAPSAPPARPRRHPPPGNVSPHAPSRATHVRVRTGPDGTVSAP